MKVWDTLIIGSGISSLTCATLLAKKGKSVCILEKYKKPGGYMHNFNRFGFRFDTGAHYVGALDVGQPFHTLLEYLDVFDGSLFTPLDSSGFDVFLFPEFSVKIPKGYEAFIDELVRTFPEERSAIQGYLGELQSVIKFFPTYEFNDEMDEARLQKILETPLSTVVQKWTNNPRLQSVLLGHCALHGVHPNDTPFGLHAMVVDSLVNGAYGFREGGDGLTRKFVERLNELGGQLRLNSEVEKFVIKDKEITEVILSNGENYFAKNIVSGIHPKATFRFCESDTFKPIFLERLRNLKESEGMFGVYATFSSEPSFFKRDRNYFHFDSSNPDEMFSITNSDLGIGSFFVSRSDREELPNQKSFPLCILSQGSWEKFKTWGDSRHGDRPSEYKDFKVKMADELFRKMEKYQPNLKLNLKQFVTSSPLTNLHFNGSEEGSPYGIYHSIENTGARALGPRTHIKNLLLTGQSCLFPGLMGAAISGLRTAGHLLGMKPLLRELADLRDAA